jgi:hypothetical protein
MQVFKIQPAYDADGNSPWDTLWYEGDSEKIRVLDCEMPLSAVWKTADARLEKRGGRPDVYVFQLHFAVTEAVRELVLPLVNDAAEFLALSVPDAEPLFVLHPLLRADFDEGAVVSRNPVSGNVTVIRKYSFANDQFEEPMHIFQVRQAPGSSGRDAGLACTGVLVSRQVKELCEEQGFEGIVFERVFEN